MSLPPLAIRRRTEWRPLTDDQTLPRSRDAAPKGGLAASTSRRLSMTRRYVEDAKGGTAYECSDIEAGALGAEAGGHNALGLVERRTPRRAVMPSACASPLANSLNGANDVNISPSASPAAAGRTLWVVRRPDEPGEASRTPRTT